MNPWQRRLKSLCYSHGVEVPVMHIAARASLTRNATEQILNGDITPTREVLIRLISALGGDETDRSTILALYDEVEKNNQPSVDAKHIADAIILAAQIIAAGPEEQR